MLPKTKIQIRVDKLSRKLPKLKADQKRWADDSVFKHYYFRTQKKNACLECGYSWNVYDRIPLDKLLDETCPRCKTTLKVLPGKKRTTRAISYFYTASVFEEFQLLRYYHISRFCKVGYRERIYITEVCQHWIRRDGRRVVRAVLHNPDSFHIDIGFYNSMEVRAHIDKYYYQGKAYPREKYLKEIRRNGYKGSTHGLNPAFFFSEILSNPHAETLLKSKQYKMLHELGGYNGESSIKEFWPSIRICLRNGYIVEDPTTWLDHLKMMKEFNMDLLNAVNVCPADLETEHQKLIRKQRIANQKKEKEQLQKDIDAYNKIFKKQKARYFGISITNGTIVVVVLDDVNDYFIEGSKLNHCVFGSRYFEKKDTLILSARKSDGERLATIELSLKEWRVLQCRGLNNKIPGEQGEIIDLVESNVNLFKKSIRKHIPEPELISA
jgi:hypothetical protein